MARRAGQDGRYALRALFRGRGFAVVAIAMLTAAIGLNTTIFAIFNALVLAPWPVADPSSVVTEQNTSDADVRLRGGGAPGGFSLDEIDYLREHSRTLAGLAAIRTGGGDQTLGHEDTPASWVSGNYFSLLGVEMALGRGFLPQEDARRAVRGGRSELRLLDSRACPRSFGHRPHAGVRRRAVYGGGGDGGALHRHEPGTRRRVAAHGLDASHQARHRWTRNVYQPRACCVRVAARLAPGADRVRAEAELAS